VFDYGDRQVYEFDRETDSCPCALIERTVGPVADVRAADGRLRATVHAADVPELRELLGELESAYGNVGVEYLVNSADGDGSELVPVDLRWLTDRQREVLATAHRMGYFEYPREANARDVADRLEIEQSTFAEHLAAAQRKLLSELLPEKS
jgi:predicted DNA binding protein